MHPRNFLPLGIDAQPCTHAVEEIQPTPSIYLNEKSRKSKMPSENFSSILSLATFFKDEAPNKPPTIKRFTIAILGKLQHGQSEFRNHLDFLGHASVGYENERELLSSLKKGRHYDLLLILIYETIEPHALTELRRMIEVPFLFLISPSEFSHAVPAIKQIVHNHQHMDFAVSPCNSWELDYRIDLLMHFAKHQHSTVSSNWSFPSRDAAEIKFGRHHFFLRKGIVRFDEAEVRLRPRAFDLALIFFQNEGILLTRDWLWNQIWGDLPKKSSRPLDACASRVRKELKLNEENGVVLSAIYGRGYKLTRLQ